MDTEDRPTTLKVGPLLYQVIWMEKDWEDERGAYGTCAKMNQIIRLAASMTPDRTACVFLHEVIHAISGALGDPPETYTSEQFANLGYGIVMVWSDNPEAHLWWCGLLNKEG